MWVPFRERNGAATPMAKTDQPGQRSPLGFVKAIDPILRPKARSPEGELANCLKRSGLRV